MIDDAFSKVGIARSLGAQLQRVRRQRQWTQRELARRSGVPYYRISKYEKGQYLPPVPILLKVAQTLGVPLDLLVPHPHGPQSETDRLLREALLEVFLLPLADRKALVALLRPILDFFRPKDTLACRGGDPPGDDDAP
jgi:transcriptional regulator with XRE-family HTH domain